MKKVFLSLVLVAGFMSNIASARGSSETSLVGKRIQIISTGTARVYIYDLPINDGCTNKIPVLILNGSDANPIGKELYSAILMAKASGKKVTIQTTGCWSGWSTPVITSMYVHD